MIKQNRLIALFDILGFGSRLKSDSLADLRRQLRLFIRAIRSEALTNTAPSLNPEHDDNLESARFVFDSVLLVSHDISNVRNVHNFVFACIRLLELGFLHRFPFRGSIILGEVFSDEETGLILGNRFPELRDGERMQDWTGCFIHDEAAETVIRDVVGETGNNRSVETPAGDQAFHLLDVPIKDSYAQFRPFKKWCLNWAHLIEERAIVPCLNYLERDQNKHRNTKQYLEYIRALPDDRQPLSGEVAPPGTFVKAIRSRHGFRAAFVDSRGNAVSMPACTLQWTAISEKKDWSETNKAKMPDSQPKRPFER